jgi:hypothetical protein
MVSTPPACTPFSAPQQGYSGRIVGRSRDAEVLGEREDDDWCKGGTVMRIAYHSNPQLTVLLTGVSSGSCSTLTPVLGSSICHCIHHHIIRVPIFSFRSFQLSACLFPFLLNIELH